MLEEKTVSPRTHPNSWAHIRVPHLCSVCECVRIHLPTPPAALKIGKTQTTPLSFLLSMYMDSRFRDFVLRDIP